MIKVVNKHEKLIQDLQHPTIKSSRKKESKSESERKRARGRQKRKKGRGIKGE